MTELLVKAVDATHPDPVKDQRGCYKQGDVVLVRDNGFEWGALEVIPPADGGKFAIIAITDVTAQQVRNWVRNHWDTDIDGIDLDQRRRRVRIDVDLLPAGVRQTLNQTGRYSTTWATARNFVRNKLTNSTATGGINA